jgi:hypothetical protein
MVFAGLKKPQVRLWLLCLLFFRRRERTRGERPSLFSLFSLPFPHTNPPNKSKKQDRTDLIAYLKSATS